MDDEAAAPVLLEQSSKNNPQSSGSARNNLRSPNTAAILKPDRPSSKYPDISGPSRTTLQRASSPTNPVLPRLSTRRSWHATSKERHPLRSSLTGTARAGRFGELLGKSGARYEGDVLAGRPHGFGKYFLHQEPNKNDYTLQYEGEWVQGRREGQGTCYQRGGEVYQGAWVDNQRQGFGVLHYANGDVFEGTWHENRRTGPGSYHFANGNIFVGGYHKDKREGMGTLLMVPQGRKYVAEYVDDKPQCGTVLDIMDEDLEPLRPRLAATITQQTLKLAVDGAAPPAQMPVLDLKQPNKVLAKQIVRVRQDRSEASKPLRAIQAASGTLSDTQLEMLRHSFILMVGSDSPSAGLQVHQLRELCVMGGLDPASTITRELVDRLLESLAADNRIHLDKFLQVICHYREQCISDAADEQLYGEEIDSAHQQFHGEDEDVSDEQFYLENPDINGTAAMLDGTPMADEYDLGVAEFADELPEDEEDEQGPTESSAAPAPTPPQPPIDTDPTLMQFAASEDDPQVVAASNEQAHSQLPQEHDDALGAQPSGDAAPLGDVENSGCRQAGTTHEGASPEDEESPLDATGAADGSMAIECELGPGSDSLTEMLQVAAVPDAPADDEGAGSPVSHEQAIVVPHDGAQTSVMASTIQESIASHDTAIDAESDASHQITGNESSMCDVPPGAGLDSTTAVDQEITDRDDEA